MKKKILFYIGFSKTGTTFIKKNILKKTKAYKYIEFNKYLTDEIFYDRDKLNKFLKSKKFDKFSKEIFKLKKNIILHKNITNPIRFIKYKKKLSYDLIFQNIKFFFC